MTKRIEVLLLGQAIWIGQAFSMNQSLGMGKALGISSVWVPLFIYLTITAKYLDQLSWFLNKYLYRPSNVRMRIRFFIFFNPLKFKNGKKIRVLVVISRLWPTHWTTSPLHNLDYLSCLKERGLLLTNYYYYFEEMPALRPKTVSVFNLFNCEKVFFNLTTIPIHIINYG